MKVNLIVMLMRILVGGTIWADAKRLVRDVQNLDHLSGKEKHARVVDDLGTLFSNASMMVLDTAAQLAAHWLKLQAK